MYLVV